MMSVQPLKSAKSACQYYTEAVNYYLSDSTATCWQGKAKDFLHLTDKINPDELMRLLEGQIPDGKQLQNLKGEHRPGFDMTLSAPKSLSVLAGLDIAPELVQLHDKAVSFALNQIEGEFAEARVNQNGEYVYQKTGNLLFATFRQPTSRANDPNLHTHCVTLNLTNVNAEFRSLSSDKSRNFGVLEQIQNNAHYCGLIYRQHLANLLKQAGYVIRATDEGLFEIEGVPDDILKLFSKRRQEIEKLMDKKGWDSAKDASHATLITRNNKIDHDLNDLKERWQSQANSLGFTEQVFKDNQQKAQILQSSISKIKEKILAFFNFDDEKSLENNKASECVNVAIEKLSQRTSVFSERTLAFESMKHSLVIDKPVSLAAIRNNIQELKSKQTLYADTCPKTQQSLLTTPWLLTLEAESIARIENNKGMVAPITTLFKVNAFQKQYNETCEMKMTCSQQEAMKSILTTKDRYIAIQGYAGVAKTTMLSWTKELIEQEGFKVRGLTIASSAAQEMTEKSGIKTDVFPLVLQELKNAQNAQLKKTVFVLDEASMLSSPQGHELIKQIERTQSRLILVGDKAQLPSVNNGRLFGLIQEYDIHTTTMDEIVRQKDFKALEAVIHATKGEVKEAIEKLHHVEEKASHDERINWIAKQWLSYSEDKRKNTLIFAATHKHRAEITEKIRDGLKEEGVLGGESLKSTSLKAKNLEAIQQRSIGYFRQGQIVRFNQNFDAKDIKQGQYYQIDKIEAKHRQKNAVPLIDETGKKILFPLKYLPNYKTHTAAFERILEVYNKNTLDIHRNETIIWTKNFKKDDIHNGERATLIDFNDKQVAIRLANGKQIDLPSTHSALQHMEHGYVLTTYKAQGKDKSYAIGLMESNQKFSANLQNFYVQISRAVHGMTLVTDDKEKLTQAIHKNTELKPASLDIVDSKKLKEHQIKYQEQSHINLEKVISRKQELEKIQELTHEFINQKTKQQDFQIGEK